jgi:hypothetical protein
VVTYDTLCDFVLWWMDWVVCESLARIDIATHMMNRYEFVPVRCCIQNVSGSRGVL